MGRDPDMREFLRDFLGITDIKFSLKRMEKVMASAKEQLAAVNTKVDDLVADVRASLEILQSKAGQLDEEGQAEVDTLVSKLDAFDSEIGDADGSDAAAPVEPTEPGAPVETGEPSTEEDPNRF